MARRLLGAFLPKSAFVVEFTNGTLPADLLNRLLSGDLAALFVRSALSEEACTALVSRFWTSLGRVPRPDGVTGYYVGAYHYGKAFDTYVESTKATAQRIDELFEGIVDPVQLVMTAVAKAVADRSISVRLAQWRGRPAARARALSWGAEGKYLLAPHDDVGQLTTPLQSDFEIQRVADFRVLAVNVYLQVPQPGGNLRIWNIQPNAACRRAFGVEHTGYPYPEESLSGVSYMDLEVESGAIVISNGGLVHAVTGYGTAPKPGEERLLINFFFGQVDRNTIVYWV